MQFFLTWKAWQIFLLIAVLPFGTQILITRGMVSIESLSHLYIFVVLPLITLVFMALLLAWFWTLGTELNKIFPEGIRPNPSRFKFGIIFSASYMVFFQVFITSLAYGFNIGMVALPIIFLLHIAAMYFMFYSIYFIGKNLVTYENNASGEAKSSLGTFFLIWFFPIGIWFVQPRINRMYAAAGNSSPKS